MGVDYPAPHIATKGCRRLIREQYLITPIRLCHAIQCFFAYVTNGSRAEMFRLIYFYSCAPKYFAMSSYFSPYVFVNIIAVYLSIICAKMLALYIALSFAYQSSRYPSKSLYSFNNCSGSKKSRFVYQQRKVEVVNITIDQLFICLSSGEDKFKFMDEYVVVKSLVFIVFSFLASSNITLSQDFLIFVLHCCRQSESVNKPIYKLYVHYVNRIKGGVRTRVLDYSQGQKMYVPQIWIIV